MQPLQDDRSTVFVLASTVGCGTKVVAEAMINTGS